MRWHLFEPLPYYFRGQRRISPHYITVKTANCLTPLTLLVAKHHEMASARRQSACAVAHPIDGRGRRSPASSDLSSGSHLLQWLRPIVSR